MTRELDAVVESAERATRQILGAAEDIEDAANTLSASLKRQQEQALALNMQDNVLRIFEACNFQDLTGQRIAKVLTTLKFVEERIAHMIEIWGGIDAFRTYTATAATDLNGDATLHGPKLDGDDGHVSQDDVDAMFARPDSFFEHDFRITPSADARSQDRRTTPAPGSRPARARPDQTRVRRRRRAPTARSLASTSHGPAILPISAP